MSCGAVRSINYALQCIERRDGGNINKPFFYFIVPLFTYEHLECCLFLPLSLRLLKYKFKILFINSHYATEIFVMSLKTKTNFVCS